MFAPPQPGLPPAIGDVAGDKFHAGTPETGRVATHAAQVLARRGESSRQSGVDIAGDADDDACGHGSPFRRSAFLSETLPAATIVC